MSDSNTWMKVRKIEVFYKTTKVNLVGLIMKSWKSTQKIRIAGITCWQEITCLSV
jgi:hypothetical protein